MRLRRWLRYRIAVSFAANEHVGSGNWLTCDAARELRERERRFAGIYRHG